MNPRAGFTLVETLVALVLVAAAGALAAGFLRAPPAAVAVDAELRRLADVLNRARADAVASQRESRVVIDATARSYGVEGAASRRLPDEVAMSADLIAGGARQVGAVRFFPAGTASGGTIRLATRGAEGAVHVNWATGAVSIERATR